MSKSICTCATTAKTIDDVLIRPTICLFWLSIELFKIQSTEGGGGEGEASPPYATIPPKTFLC